jgi:hypothetical protein
MSRGPCTFKQQDVTRALRATVAAGIEVQRIEIEKDGKIIVVTGNAGSTNEHATDLEKWKAKHARQA